MLTTYSRMQCTFYFYLSLLVVMLVVCFFATVHVQVREYHVGVSSLLL